MNIHTYIDRYTGSKLLKNDADYIVADVRPNGLVVFYIDTFIDGWATGRLDAITFKYDSQEEAMTEIEAALS